MPQTKLQSYHKSCKIRKRIFGGDINNKTKSGTEYQKMVHKMHKQNKVNGNTKKWTKRTQYFSS